MKKFIIISLALLSSCAHVQSGKGRLSPEIPPVVNQPPVTTVPPQPIQPPVAVPPQPVIIMPDLPVSLKQAPTPLPDLIDGTTKGLIKDSADTSIMYNALASRYSTIVAAWSCMKDAVNKRDTAGINACLK